MSGRDGCNRRDFLRRSVCAAAAVALGLRGAEEAQAGGDVRRARVVLVRDAEALDGAGKCNEAVVTRMLDRGVAALFGTEEPMPCWKTILEPTDLLGIKTNEWRPLRTPVFLEDALRSRALAVGIAKENVSIRDRGVLDDPVFQRSTALINIRPLRTHHWAGIGGCLKNYIMFTREPSAWHDDSCADLGGLWKLPVCRGKTRLNILVALTPLFYGIGPHHFDPAHVWQYKGLLVGTDPVALDAIGVKLLEEKRKRFFERPPRGGTSTKHVRLADTRHGIGVADLDRIELVKIGWIEDLLI